MPQFVSLIITDSQTNPDRHSQKDLKTWKNDKNTKQGKSGVITENIRTLPGGSRDIRNLVRHFKELLLV